MQPELYKNDVIFVKKCTLEEININDIITFKKNEEETVTHRVIDILHDNGNKVYFITKGDNNKVQDDFFTEYEQVYGKVIFHISKLGNFVEYIQNTNGFINFTILILVIFIFINSRDKKKNIRKTKRRKYEIKRIRDNYNIKEENIK